MNFYAMTDSAIESELGKRLAAHRLRKNITQEDIAHALGISRTTYNQLEKGAGKISTLIAAMRYLNCLDALDSFLPPIQFSPLTSLKLSRQAHTGRYASNVLTGKQRARASSKMATQALRKSDPEVNW